MPAKQRHGRSGCPAADCSGGRPQRQHQITDGQLERISGDARATVEARPASVYRCNYCGAVYVRDERPRLLGYLDNEIIGKGWHPIHDS